MNQSNKYYFNNPDVWDTLRSKSFEKEANFIEKIITNFNPSAKRILDVGCGSGKHCYLLSQLGFETVGVDLNPNMINYTKRKYPSNQFFEMDMKHLDLGILGQFDVLLCLCTTFTYNITNEEIDKTLSSFSNLLKVGGLIILEFFNPISFLAKNNFNGSFFRENPDNYKTSNLTIDVVHTVEEREQSILEMKKIYSLKTKKLLAEDKTKFRLLFPQEIRYHLKQHGLVAKEQFGKYDTDYKNLDSTRLITVAIKE